MNCSVGWAASTTPLSAGQRFDCRVVYGVAAGSLLVARLSFGVRLWLCPACGFRRVNIHECDLRPPGPADATT